ncbi:MAG: hypothetical protein K0R28_5520, partial [Paenibacillus sp.]|nr:hypothetical protein [Paenibacillus sp.]
MMPVDDFYGMDHVYDLGMIKIFVND